MANEDKNSVILNQENKSEGLNLFRAGLMYLSSFQNNVLLSLSCFLFGFCFCGGVCVCFVVFYFQGVSVPWWTYISSCILYSVYTICKQNPVVLMKLEFFTMYIHKYKIENLERNSIQSWSGAHRFAKGIFPLWRISQELPLRLKDGKMKGSPGKHLSL